MKTPSASRFAGVAIAALGSLAGTLHAATIPLVGDAFDSSSDVANYARWRADTDGTQSTVTYSSGALSITSSGTADGKGDNLTGRSFAQTTLGVGDTLTLSYDFTSNSGSTGTANFQRMGLYNLGAAFSDGTLGLAPTTKDGYYSFFANNATSGTPAVAAVLRRETISDTLTDATKNTVEGVAANTLLGSTSTKATIGTATRSVVFTVTNLGGGVTSVTSTLFSAAGGTGTALYSLSGSDASGFTSFDSIFLLTPTGTTVIYDNINLTLTTAIPEPSSAAICLGGVALATGFGLRRRRRAA